MKFHKLTKSFVITASAIAAISIISGCSKNKAEDVFTDYPQCGISIPLASDLEENSTYIETYGTNDCPYNALFIFFQYKPALDALSAEMDELAKDETNQQDLFEMYSQKSQQHYKQLATLYLVPEAEFAEYEKNGFPEGFETLKEMQKLGKKNDFLYLLFFPKNTTDGMDEIELTQYNYSLSSIKKSLKKAKLIDFIEPPSPQVYMPELPEFPPAVPAFTTQDLFGNTVTQDIFTKKDLTVVNIWGTFCEPCIAELPDMAVWAATMQKNTQLIGIVCDVASPEDTENIEAAKSLLKQCGAEFTNIIINDDILELLKSVQYVPTTFLVDKEGHIVGEPILDITVDAYKNAVKNYFASK